MKKLLLVLCAVMIVFCVTGSASANFFIDFEDGLDGAFVNDITGVSFKDFNGYDSIYGDSRIGKYNTTSDDLGYGHGSYHHNGNFWLWAGPNADARGVIIDFTSDDGTWFETGYSSSSEFNVEAFLTDGTMVTVAGAGNTNSPMDYLRIEATAGLFIDYLVLHDAGNHWLVDDMSGDASGVGPVVPEPSTILLLGAGFLGLVGYSRKRLSKKS